MQREKHSIKRTNADTHTRRCWWSLKKMHTRRVKLHTCDRSNRQHVTRAAHASCDPDETPHSGPCKQWLSHSTPAFVVHHVLHSHTFKDNDLNYSQAHAQNTPMQTSVTYRYSPKASLLNTAHTHILKSSSIYIYIMSKKKNIWTTISPRSRGTWPCLDDDTMAYLSSQLALLRRHGVATTQTTECWRKKRKNLHIFSPHVP